MRALALSVGPIVVALGFGSLGWFGSAWDVEPLLFKATSHCNQPPSFKPVYQAGRDFLQTRGDGFHFASEAMLGATLCSAGTLEITANGELGGVEQPQLTVFFEGDVLTKHYFNRQSTLELPISKAGRVFMGFFNDFYLTDSRVIFIQGINLYGPGCKELSSIHLTLNSGVEMNPITGIALLASGTPLTFMPCRSGQLRLSLRGQKGNKKFPIFQVSQNGNIIYKNRINKDWIALKLQVEQSPLTFRLVNPYWKTVADRNLNVLDINFIPNTK